MINQYSVKLTILCLLVVESSLLGQRFNHLECGFTIIEKRNNDQKNLLILGDVYYDIEKKESLFKVKFPQEEKWEIIDTFLYKYVKDSLISTKAIGTISDQFVFSKILQFKGNTFELDENGFIIENVNEKDDKIVIRWTPPEVAQTFLQYAETQVKDNLLASVRFIDVDGKAISEIFFEEYKIVQGIPIPIHVISKFQGESEILYKVLKLKNVNIY